MTVPFVFLNITFNGGVIGNASQNNVTVVYGVNNINFDVFLDGTSNNLVPDFIMNSTLNFGINGSLQYGR